MRIRMIAVGIVAVVLGSVNIATSVELTEFIVKFYDQSVSDIPQFSDSGFALVGPDKSLIQPEVLSRAVYFKHFRPAASIGDQVSGPYSIYFADIGDIDSLLAGLEADSRIEHAALAVTTSGVTAEQAITSSPPATKDLLCVGGQKWIHRRQPSEPTFGGDYCDLVSTDIFDHDIDLPQAWAITRGRESVVVAVIDLGVDWTHPDIGGSGPASSTTFPDSIINYFNDGILFKNTNESPGDANGDGAPGALGFDDDGDGLIDEDSQNLERGNSAEPDVILGIATSTNGLTVYDSNANFVPGSLIGLEFYGLGGFVTGNHATIVSNTATSITTDPIPFDTGTFWYDWEDFIRLWNYKYRIGDGQDNDGDLLIDDEGWLGDLIDDDDENGYNDDFCGYDFVDAVSPANPYIYPEDAIDIDNDVRSNYHHGTWVAAMVATAPIQGHLIGVAPKIRILPIKAGGRSTFEGNNQALIDKSAYIEGMMYARTMGADIVVTALGSGGVGMMVSTIDTLTESGIIFVNGAANDTVSVAHEFNAAEGAVLVAGVDHDDVRRIEYYYDESGHLTGAFGSRIGNWVDISAPVGWFQCATPVGQDITHGAAPEAGITYPDGLRYFDGRGTSLSGPIVAGVMALVKSAYPHFGSEDVINKVLSSVDDIYSIPENQKLVGQLGSGRVNAYKALTFYGAVPASVPDTTWTDTVWVSGDLVVPADKTLTIGAGTVVKMAQDDIRSTGTDPSGIELIVNGTLNILGTTGDPVLFECFTDNDEEWGPILFDGIDSGASSTMQHVVFRNMETAIVKRFPGADASITISNCTFETSGSAIDLDFLDSDDVISISNSTFTATDPGAMYAVAAYSATIDGEFSLSIGPNVTIQDYMIGLRVEGPNGASINGVTVTNCSGGMLIQDGSTSPHTIGPDVIVDTTVGAGILALGAVQLDDVTVIDAGQSAFEIQGNVTVGSGGVVIQNPGLHGIVVSGSSGATVLSNLTVQNATNTGLRIVGCSPDIGPDISLTGCGYNGIYLDNSDSNIDGVTISGSDTGIWAASGSDPVVRNVSVSNALTGIMVDSFSGGDYGAWAGYQMNSFANITRSYVINMNPNHTLSFYNNCYDGSPTPDPSMIGSKKVAGGPINYIPGYCD